MRTTIKDVAKAAGVSPSTVSLVMNGKDSAISEKTKNAVAQAAKALHYRPNQLAVGLATNRSNSIGLVLPDIGNPFFSELAKHIERAAMEEEYTVLVSSTDDDCKHTCNSLFFFYDRQVDGIILAQTDFQAAEETEKIFRAIEDIQIPIVLVDRVNERYSLPAVLVDQQKIGYMATQHLLEQGHRRIGCVAGPMGICSVRDRVAGYRRALRDFQVPFDESLIYHGKYDIQTGVEAVPFLLGKKVTAALCCSDTLAFGVYREMRNLHRRIPEDLSVVSVDDTVLADIIQPPLTSVSQPIPDVAAQAVSTLIRLIHHPEQSLKPIPKLEPTLKVRASVSRILV